ncbi:hypothetical protein TREMEDRAFT_61457 [Tremella mesenterica DSM 1558]|uniref:uncharacterized protein n=1 Tax=Tremella mesenterica (strain ATCC 24925 / CBS 8224 / DSM 1558 / NBRC 9311 / NRRL Y-6157 / RJB 2259-6 / UBC 559-6) TaxID=578456 RepID=UPI0003F494EB|nr:uncharacterized protein TREMEDRAFT_61457 [Tremella mesenterica DSM 1558]EIW70942.1 hypothetical protein TREMEDRAFT_61457 [Tremella mesenterica DSM 1558]
MSTDNHSIRNYSYMGDWEYSTGEDISYDRQAASTRDDYGNTESHYTFSNQAPLQYEHSWSQIHPSNSHSFQQTHSQPMTSWSHESCTFDGSRNQESGLDPPQWQERLRGMGITKETRYSQLLLLIHQLQPVSLVRSLLYGLENLGYARKEWVESVDDERSVEGVCVALLESLSVHGGTGSLWLNNEAQGDDMFPGVYHSG